VSQGELVLGRSARPERPDQMSVCRWNGIVGDGVRRPSTLDGALRNAAAWFYKHKEEILTYSEYRFLSDLEQWRLDRVSELSLREATEHPCYMTVMTMHLSQLMNGIDSMRGVEKGGRSLHTCYRILYYFE
jgi:hypothetical protein